MAAAPLLKSLNQFNAQLRANLAATVESSTTLLKSACGSPRKSRSACTRCAPCVCTFDLCGDAPHVAATELQRFAPGLWFICCDSSIHGELWRGRIYHSPLHSAATLHAHPSTQGFPDHSQFWRQHHPRYRWHASHTRNQSGIELAVFPDHLHAVTDRDLIHALGLVTNSATLQVHPLHSTSTAET